MTPPTSPALDAPIRTTTEADNRPDPKPVIADLQRALAAVLGLMRASYDPMPATMDLLMTRAETLRAEADRIEREDRIIHDARQTLDRYVRFDKP